MCYETTTQDKTPGSRSTSHTTEELFLLNREGLRLLGQALHHFP
jgi:hypothetical protein